MTKEKQPSRIILDDFEHEDLTKYTKDHMFVSSYALDIIHDNGGKSLKLSYHLGGWTTGNGAMYIQFKEKLETKTDDMPLSLALWVHGDGNVPWLRATLIDGEGSRKIMNLTEGSINWKGWKYVDAAIDNSWPLPITLEKIYAVETDKSLQGRDDVYGDIYFNTIQFVYKEDFDLKGPEFKHVHPKDPVIYTDSFVFSAQVYDDQSGVDPDSIQVKVNDELVPHVYNEGSGIIEYPVNNLGKGDVQLNMTAKDLAGNRSLPDVNETITIDLSSDLEEPIISDLTPTAESITHSTTPLITFNVQDKKSGIDVKDIKVSVNGALLDMMYDEETGWCYGYPKQPLPSGEHQLKIIVSDRAGNQLGPIEHHFFTERLPEVDPDKSVKMPIIPDTHSVDYLKLLLQNIVWEEADVMLHLGDMVDGAMKEEFQQVNQVFSEPDVPVLLPVAGNHESFLGHLNLFQETFGSPTYHLEYGHALIIVLNSSFEQSLSASDSTQLHYLERLLNENKQRHIIIATHVPTQDTFGTSHQMKAEDAQKFERILSDYKRQHQQVSITVLFGHLHVLQSWEKDGITYIVTGNGAGKGYIPHDKGDILGYGVLEWGHSDINYHYHPVVKDLFIHPGAEFKCYKQKPYSKLEISVGDEKQLHAFGCINVLKSHYTVDLSSHCLIPIYWDTSDERILSVSPTGNITGKEIGKAIMTATMMNAKTIVKSKITIEVTP